MLQRRIADLVEGKPNANESVTVLLRRESVSVWLEAAAHAEPVVRAAAAKAASKRTEEAVVARLGELLRDESESVSTAMLNVLGDGRQEIEFDPTSLGELFQRTGYDHDAVGEIAKTLGGKPEYVSLLVLLLRKDDYETKTQACDALKLDNRDDVVLPVLQVLSERSYADRSLFALLEHHLNGVDADVSFELLTEDQKSQVGTRAYDVRNEFPLVWAAASKGASHKADTVVLATFGRLLSAESRSSKLPRAFLVDNSVQRVIERLQTTDGPRSALILGASGTGKSSLIYEVVHQMVADGWEAVEFVPSQLLVGTRYLGEWETRVQALVDAAKAPNKVLLVVPQVHELLQVGKSAGKETNVAGILSPLMERGEIVVIGEAVREEFTAATAGKLGFRQLFAEFEAVPATVEATRQLAHLVAEEAGLSLTPEFGSQLVDLADGLITSAERPGRALNLLRRAIDLLGAAPTVRGLLEILSHSTGAPVEFLDANTPLDLNYVRRSLEDRVIGQPVAIDAVLDTITLVKAGLTDPQRPNGVLLFVGPTGVGKTELARALAKVLFGDEARLKRFDMSEFASYESYQRLLGTPNGSGGVLIDAVRNQPFTILLFDEIEKAHSNVFDLFLQLFDAGRLTDVNGRSADFRNAVIIMTSNAGSAVGTRAPAGFSGAPLKPSVSTVEKALQLQFRPEFLGRIDRIVMFQPLDAETSGRIVRREVTSMLARNGITQRRIAVDVDPQVIESLLRRGYSEAFGARPLKRAIEQYFLLPLAREIATGRIESGSAVRVTVGDDETVHISAVRERLRKADPDGKLQAESQVSGRSIGEFETGSGRDHRPDRAALELIAELYRGLDDLRPNVEVMTAEKMVLLIKQSEPGFWDDQYGALRILDRVQRLDRVVSDVGRLGRDVERTERNRDRRIQASYLQAHKRDLARLEELTTGNDLRDACVIIDRLGDVLDPDSLAGKTNLDNIVLMYRGFASRHRLECDVVHDSLAPDRVILAVTGVGAVPLFQAEAGHHRFVDDRRGTEHFSVEVLPLEFDVNDDFETLTTITTRRTKTAGRFIEPSGIEVTATVVNTAVQSAAVGLRSVTLINDLEKERATDTALLILQALQGRAAAPSVEVVRRYELTSSPLVVGANGIRTGRLREVLAGNLELVRD